MIDSHCHIGMDESLADVETILSRAKEQGVNSVLTVACHPLDYPILIKLLKTYPTVYGSFGMHPEYAHEMPPVDELIQKIQAHPRIVGVGEIGLDYHYMSSSKDIQRTAFEKQIELANQVHKPIIIHSREADEDMMAILTAAHHAGLLQNGGVLHCFTSGPELAKKALELGFYISASGVITFKMAEEIRDIFRIIPLDRLLVETDAPYLAPVPYRGRVNEPAYVLKTAEKLAELKGVSLKEIDKITTFNFNKLFRIEAGK